MKKQKELKYVDRRCRDKFVPKKLRQAFGWRQVGVAEKSKSWIGNDGHTREIKKNYCVMRRVKPYSHNLIFLLTELIANVFYFLRAALWALLIPLILLWAFTAGDLTAGMLPLEGETVALATAGAFLAVYAGCYICIFLGNFERKLFGIDKKFADCNYAVQSGSSDLKVDIRILEDKNSMWRSGAKRAQAFGWKVYDNISLEREMLFTRWKENDQRRARNAEKLSKYDELVDAAIDEYGVDEGLIDYARKEYIETLEEMDNTLDEMTVYSHYTALVRPIKYNRAVKLLEKVDLLFLYIRNFAIIATIFLLLSGVASSDMYSIFLIFPIAVWAGAIICRTIFVILAKVLRSIGTSEDEAWFAALNLPVHK